MFVGHVQKQFTTETTSPSHPPWRKKQLQHSQPKAGRTDATKTSDHINHQQLQQQQQPTNQPTNSIDHVHGKNTYIQPTTETKSPTLHGETNNSNKANQKQDTPTQLKPPISPTKQQPTNQPTNSSTDRQRQKAMIRSTRSQ